MFLAKRMVGMRLPPIVPLAGLGAYTRWDNFVHLFTTFPNSDLSDLDASGKPLQPDFQWSLVWVIWKQGRN